jgi:hypothetical protein
MPRKAGAKLRAGERLVDVAEWNKPKPTRPSVWPNSISSGVLINPRRYHRPVRVVEPATAKTTTKADVPNLNLKEYKRITNFLKFIRKKEVIAEFMWMLMNTADDAELESIIHSIDLFEEEGREECQEETDPGMSAYWDAAGLGTTSESRWPGFWPD